MGIHNVIMHKFSACEQILAWEADSPIAWYKQEFFNKFGECQRVGEWESRITFILPPTTVSFCMVGYELMKIKTFSEPSKWLSCSYMESKCSKCIYKRKITSANFLAGSFVKLKNYMQTPIFKDYHILLLWNHLLMTSRQDQLFGTSLQKLCRE